ncbi:2-octaprenyl-3-methyl-6-methoxy-1,4-benzoquinol hydroxylase [Maritalea myrionectae]|uniref:2-octaprenyl-3-methyl-6-methoxy-1,4-benzoquinol hydroxylase n=1 Tax=Maritalea myrionectae TaxID=454601 RepID=A0A2R4MA21_9HYPH|nr:FAD-dependent monooxygenase [Maritalea myrionectae]AVX02862.1 2-octaprenyl-3-methyl-6-methoxy-1,4-benzoquinol hydroxylase [Maritalea myrionectae]
MARAKNKAQKLDILIVGAGPAGLTLALALKQAMPELQVGLNDVHKIEVPQKDGRASALALGVTSVFEALGVWTDMLPDASPIDGMHITDSSDNDLTRPLFLRFEGDVKPGQPFAHMVPNKSTIGALLNRLDEFDVEMIAPDKVASIVPGDAFSTVEFDSGKLVEASVVVAADGARSMVREMMGIATTGHDYGQSGIVTTIEHELDHNNIAYEHFLPHGPFASLPLPSKRSSLVWSEKSKLVPEILAMPEEELAREIERKMGSSLGKVKVLAPAQAFPLRLQIAKEFVADRVALIGDAAHVVHPIAGQGMNLGLKDVAALAEVLVEAVRHGQDLGSVEVLERYQRLRRFDTGLMALATDALNVLFSNDQPVVRVARDVGLGLVDRAPFLKNAFIGHAAAANDELRLLKGLPL